MYNCLQNLTILYINCRELNLVLLCKYVQFGNHKILKLKKYVKLLMHLKNSQSKKDSHKTFVDIININLK